MTKLVGDELLEAGAVPAILDVIFRPGIVEVFRRNFDPTFSQLLVTFPQ